MNIHSNGLLDMLLSRKIKKDLLKEDRIADHHSFKNTGWTSFYICDQGDAGYARHLLRMAWLKISQSV